MAPYEPPPPPRSATVIHSFTGARPLNRDEEPRRRIGDEEPRRRIGDEEPRRRIGDEEPRRRVRDEEPRRGNRDLENYQREGMKLCVEHVPAYT